jgi:hypothetical protein
MRTKFNADSSTGSHVENRIDGQANGQNDEANSRFSQIWELA